MQATEFSTALSRIITETKLQQVAALLTRVLTGENISASNLHDSFSKAVFSARSELDALKKDPTLLNVIQTLAIDDPLEPVRAGHQLQKFGLRLEASDLFSARPVRNGRYITP